MTGTSWLEHFTRITQAASGISIVIGIVLGLTQIYKASTDLKEAAQSAKMNALPSVRDLIREDDQIQPQMRQFLQDYDKDKLRELLGKYPNVRSAYHSPELEGLRMAGHHYEQMGALVKSGYVDFNLIFEVVDFPDDFWETTEPLRSQAKTRWSSNGGLPDFWKNFSYLQCRFEVRRKGKPEPSGVCRNSS